jgi:hypothetical protein
MPAMMHDEPDTNLRGGDGCDCEAGDGQSFARLREA